MANIIGFNASPRKSGNTAWTVERILEGASSEGATIRLFHCGSMNLNPCRGCLGCTKGGGCVVNDDMQQVYAALKDADALVLGAPIFMGQMSGQAKAFTDRLFAVIKPRFSPMFNEAYAGKKLMLAWTQGNPNQDMFKVYLDYTRAMFEMLEFDVFDTVVVAGTREGLASDQEGLGASLGKIGAELARA